MKELAVALGLFLFGCGSSDDESDGGGTQPNAYELPGEYPVGHATFELVDTARSRTLLVTAWYPAAESARDAATSGEPIQNLTPEGPDRDSYVGWLATAPEACTTRTSHSATDADLADGTEPFPVIAFSHCHNCIRFSAMSIAERLASHGFVVVAPDHTGNTMFDELPTLDPTFLAIRAGDIRFVLDQVLDPNASRVPASLRGRLDASRVGMLGHSFGGVTTGLVVQDDPRPRAGLSIAAPMENPLLAGVDLSTIQKPLAFLVAKEDHSIGAIGNTFIQNNFEAANPPVFDVKVADAGHWSFSDICSLRPEFAAGCGSEQRQENSSETFDYIPVDDATAIAQAYITAFFSGEVLGEGAGLDYVRGQHPAAIVESTSRE
jgi:dienelactone hydrolase